MAGFFGKFKTGNLYQDENTEWGKILSRCVFNLQEVPQPEFTSKPETQWTEEEKKSFKEYEKKANELREEQEKYKKVCGVSHKTLKKSLPKKVIMSFCIKHVRKDALEI